MKAHLIAHLFADFAKGNKKYYTSQARRVMFDNSFWDSGYPIGIGILIVYIIISKIHKEKKW